MALMVSQSYRILEREEGPGVRNQSPERGRDLPKDIELVMAKETLVWLSRALSFYTLSSVHFQSGCP